MFGRCVRGGREGRTGGGREEVVGESKGHLRRFHCLVLHAVYFVVDQNEKRAGRSKRSISYAKERQDEEREEQEN